MQLTTLTHDRLRYNPEINARRDTETDVGELAATIKQQGLGQPLLVRRDPSTPEGLEWYYNPVEGGRRFRAIGQLIAAGELPADFPIPVLIRELSDAEAIALSLATSVTRMPLNAADEAISFQKLITAGESEATIAAHFGVPVKRVRQRLAIAALPAEIVEALRKGEITIAIAQAFTLASDPRLVAKLWADVAGDTHSHPDWLADWIRAEITSKRVPATSREAEFIGEETYLKAGGAIDEDLFGNDRWLADGKLVNKLFEQKIKADTKRYLAEGWSFVLEDRDASFGSKYDGWPRLEAEGKPNLSKADEQKIATLKAELKRLRKEKQNPERQAELGAEIEQLTACHFTAAQKKKAGVLFRFGRDRVEIMPGIMKPKDAKRAQAETAKASKQKARDTSKDPSPVRRPEELETDFTSALNAELARAMSQAMQTAIIVKPGLAKRALAAALIAGRPAWEGPFRFESNARYSFIADTTAEIWREIALSYDGKSLGEIFDELLRTPTENVDAIIAAGLARLFNIDSEIKPEHKRLIIGFDPDCAAIWQPGEEFFKKLSRDALVHALGEAAIAGVTPSKKKKELVEIALRELPKLGWLPKPLRAPNYKGPGSNAFADRNNEAPGEAAAPITEMPAEQAA
jgi:ParB family transcriptional regulator, chromosome partitioning protein